MYVCECILRPLTIIIMLCVDLGQDTLKKLQDSEPVHGAKSFKKTFTDELKEGLKKLNEDTKKK